jgi:putative hemolysin
MMMSTILFEVAIVVILVIVNGIFSMAEIAVVSSRKARLQRRKDEGSRGAAVALALAGKPDDFLSTVQIGITLIGVFTGAYSGITLAEQLGPRLDRIRWIAPHGEDLALTIVVIATTYVTLIIGELVPKRLALRSPERIAAALAPAMAGMSRAARPAVWLLSKSTSVVMKLFGRSRSNEPAVTADELKMLLEQGTALGEFHEAEQEMVEGVFALDDRQATSLMTPRQEIVWLDANATPDAWRATLLAQDHDKYPVCDGSIDRIIGVARARDLLKECLSGARLDLRSILRKATFVPEFASALDVLDTLRQADTRFAIVIDEYGGVEGLLTLNDLVQEIVGRDGGSTIMQRGDGSWLVDGSIPIAEFREFFGEPSFEAGPFHTLAGFIMSRLGHIPKTADVVEWRNFRFEVVDMDGRRVDKVLVSRRP